MFRFSLLASALLLARAVCGQDLDTALAAYPQASSFAQILAAHPEISNLLLTNVTNVSVLIPSNDALTRWAAANGGKGLTDGTLTDTQIIEILQYHIVVKPLTGTDFSGSGPGGLVVPTLLTNQQYNNRSAGPQLQNMYGTASEGQVLFFSTSDISNGQQKVKVRRQTSTASTSNVRGGLDQTTQLQLVDGKWSGGTFQIVNDVLIPPMPCSNTIRNVTSILSALDAALNKTGLYPTLDHANNVTCLAPSTTAFSNAGNPQDILNQTELSGALLYHTLPMPLYTEFLTDGMNITSLANLTVTVRVNSSGIWFNDAKVIGENVLTNNGLIHILDKVMSVNASASSNSSSTKTGAGSLSKSPHSIIAVLFGMLISAMLL